MSVRSEKVNLSLCVDVEQVHSSLPRIISGTQTVTAAKTNVCKIGDGRKGALKILSNIMSNHTFTLINLLVLILTKNMNQPNVSKNVITAEKRKEGRQ